VQRIAIVLAAAVWLGACATLPEGPPVPEGGFEITGRVAVRYGKEGASGRIFWRHSRLADDLLITSPLGQGIARIGRQGEEFRLVTPGGKEYRAADAQSLTESVLGWRLPLEGLPDWVQGGANPGRPAELRRDATLRVLELVQDGWRVEYQEFQGERPSRLRLSRDDLEIRLTIDQWVR
jgi:outer membrane lipoprotein LolB